MCSAVFPAAPAAFFIHFRRLIAPRLHRGVTCIALLLLCVSGTKERARAQDVISAVHGYNLTIVVDGVRNSVGTIGMLLFNSSLGWPDELRSAYLSKSVPAVAGSTVLSLSGLPEGDYGVLVIHDENGNQKLDRDWKGVPKEQWGMSNNPRVFLSAPGFEQARFHLNSDRELHIKLK